MMRIRGKIGDWPVDLIIELDDQEIQHLNMKEPPRARNSSEQSAVTSEVLWQKTLDMLRLQGVMEGPELLAWLADLAGSEVAGKRLLVRLRHCEQVSVSGNGGEIVTYHWLADK